MGGSLQLGSHAPSVPDNGVEQPGDYLTKPFSVLELVARVRALIRRPVANNPRVPQHCNHLIRAGSLVMDCWQQCAIAFQIGAGAIEAHGPSDRTRGWLQTPAA